MRKGINDVQKQAALNQRKVAVNLTGGYITSGLAGTELTTTSPFATAFGGIADRLNQLSNSAGLPSLPPINFGGGVPGNLVGGYGQSLSNMFSGNFNSFQGGLSIDWTPRNNAAESSLAQTTIGERRIALQRRQTEQGIEAQVRNALQALTTSEQRITAAESGARAAKEKLDSETRLFQTGESTNFFVLTRQNEFSDAKRRVVVATLEFNKSVARLEQAVGKTLEQHAVKLK
jgi:hypothetical protein